MKKKAIMIAVLLLAAAAVVGVIPFSKNIRIKETAIEYSLTDEAVAVPHEVFIEGKYYTKLLGKDSFTGTFYVSDIKNLDIDMQAEFEFEPRFRYYNPQFGYPLQLPKITEIGVVFFDRNFNSLAFQLAYEYIEKAGGISMSCRDDESNFIVLGTNDRDEALKIYQKLLERK